MTSKDEERPEASDSSGHTPSEAPKAHEAGPVKHKTISCTQCRKRKLKCDRGKPSCGTCSRLQHQCVYPEGRMKSTAKRRNVKDLEARLAQVETLLSSEAASKLSSSELPLRNGRTGTSPATGTGTYWDDLEIDMIMADDMKGVTNQASLGLSVPPLTADQYFANELIGSGLQENLPPQETIDELHDIYFASIHTSAPTLQKYRYLANVHLLPPLGPPICLRYAVWAVAASASEKYTSHQEVFYQRARKYAEIDEMKGQGEHFISVSHAQCWSLLSNYEAQTMYLSRAWISGGKCIRLAQMMNLHHLDGGGEDTKQIIGPARDWIELEERRRTFWAAFCCDRYSCAGTGWPMTIDERDITTRLPASEEAYEKGHEEITTTLSEAMTAEGAARVSPYAGVVLMACLFGHNWLHLHRPGLNDHPEDFMEGEFWKRHRKMDNVLSNTFMFLPERLRLPTGLHDPNIVYLNMNIHASTICLHQAAILKAEKHGLDPRISKQSQARCRVAAQEIVNIMRLISHFNISEMNTWVSFNLYIATGVLIEGCHSPETSQESRSNLDFLLTALQAIGKKHVVTQAFIAQLKIDLEGAGISSPFGEINKQKKYFGSVCSPAIDARNFKSRVEEFSADMINQSIFATGVPSSVNGSSESCSTSEKESLTPPQDSHNHPDFRGILPKQSMAERLRRATQFSPGNFNRHEKLANDIPKFFNIPALLGQYPTQGGRQSVQLQGQSVETISNPLEGQQPPFSSTLASQQQFLPAENGTYMEQDLTAFYSGTATNSMSPDWAFGPLENSALPGFSGFELSSQDGQDLNYLLNGAPWDGSSFQA